jgi:DNA repair protein RecO (recombination protein O)
VAGTFKDKGLVIKEYPAGERDKRLTLLLFDRGRVTLFAKGACGPKSKFHACSQVFAFSDLVFYEGAGFLSVAQCELNNNFFGLREDFERLCLAGHALEMAERMILPGMSCQNELRLIYLTLSRLMDMDYPPRLVAAVFELKFLQLGGFIDKTLPEVDFTSSAAKAVAWVLEHDIKDIFAFKLGEPARIEISDVLGVFRRGILDSPSKSLELLDRS